MCRCTKWFEDYLTYWSVEKQIAKTAVPQCIMIRCTVMYSNPTIINHVIFFYFYICFQYSRWSLYIFHVLSVLTMILVHLPFTICTYDDPCASSIYCLYLRWSLYIFHLLSALTMILVHLPFTVCTYDDPCTSSIYCLYLRWSLYIFHLRTGWWHAIISNSGMSDVRRSSVRSWVSGTE